MAALSLCPSLVALIVAEPAATPLTSPLADTVATDDALLAQVIVRPLSGFPFESLGVAVSWSVAPTGTFADAGLTATEATGTGVTVMADVPLLPSLVAVIVAEPATTPLTSPLEDTVATEDALLAQVIVRPLSGLPLASLGVAVSCTVASTSRLADAGVTVTDATGTGAAATVTDAEPLCPSLVAVIVAEPTAAPVTRPVPFTVATVALLLAHVTVRPPSAVPFASRGVAVNCTVCPTWIPGDPGVTLTDATGAATLVTVTADESLCPSLVAMILVEPAAAPVTNPALLTVATAGARLTQVTARPDRGPPAESFVTAASCTLAPTSTLTTAGVTVTEATGTGVTATTAVSARATPLASAMTATVPGCDPAWNRQ
jgi:hypothetical protein